MSTKNSHRKTETLHSHKSQTAARISRAQKNTKMLSSAVRRAVTRPIHQQAGANTAAGLVSSACRRRGPAWQYQYYSTSTSRLSEAAAEDTADGDGDGEGEGPPPPPPFVKADAKLAARQYNDRRAAYRRAVGKLRKSYAEEIAAQRQSDEEAARNSCARTHNNSNSHTGHRAIMARTGV